MFQPDVEVVFEEVFDVEEAGHDGGGDAFAVHVEHAVEEGLHGGFVALGVVAVKEAVDARKGLFVLASLVVDDPHGVAEAVDAVDDAAQLYLLLLAAGLDGEVHVEALFPLCFQSYDLKGRVCLVVVEDAGGHLADDLTGDDVAPFKVVALLGLHAVLALEGEGDGPVEAVLEGLDVFFDDLFAPFLLHVGFVEDFHAVVQEVAKEGGVDVFCDLIGLYEAGDVAVVEAQAAGEVDIDRRGGEPAALVPPVQEAVKAGKDAVVLGDADGEGRLHARFVAEDVLADAEARLVDELLQVAAHLGAEAAGVLGVVEEMHALRPLQEAVEEVAVDGILMVYGRHAKGAAQVVGNEAVAAHVWRPGAFVHAQDDDVIKVEIAGFQHAHDLQATQRLAREGQAQVADDLTEEFEEGLEGELDGFALQ